ncbi:MAG: ABC transporter permease [Gammaproteobacteria bacterium]|nr:ABC transporter permease [Gammaproteobacteria bacterium]
MKAIFTISLHEFKMSFRSVYGWVMMALITFVGAVFFYIAGDNYITQVQYSPENTSGVVGAIGANVISIFNQTMMFLTPLITASSISAEHRNHTFVLLQSSPVSSWDIILGKFKGMQAYNTILLLVALLMIVFLRWFNPLDFYHLACIFIGSSLLLSTYAAIGIYCSSLSKNPFVSAVICLVLLLMLFFVLGIVAREYPWVEWLVISTHIRGFYLGEIDTRNIAYFALMIFTFLFLARQRLEAARRT